MTEKHAADIARWIANGPYAGKTKSPLAIRTFGNITERNFEGASRSNEELTASDVLSEVLPDLLEAAFAKAQKLFPQNENT